MKIMCDTNIILDVMLDREPFAEKSADVLKLCEDRIIEGFITASSITDIFYLIRKQTHSNDIAYNATGKLLEIVSICGVTNQEVLSAYQQRAKDFESFAVPAITPTDFMQQFN